MNSINRDGYALSLFNIGNYGFVYDINTNNLFCCSDDLYGKIKRDVDSIGTLSSNTLKNMYDKELIEPITDFPLANPPEFLNSLHEYKKKIEGNSSRIMYIPLSDHCNLRCDYCNVQRSTSVQNNMAMDKNELFNQIDKFLGHKNVTAYQVLFSGGEPLLQWERMREIVQHIQVKWSNKEVNYGLTTNGTLLNKERMAWFASYKFPIMISLDGNKDIHDAHRRTVNNEPTFEKVYSSILYLKENYPDYFWNHVQINCVLSEKKSLFDVIGFFEDRGLWNVSLSEPVQRDLLLSGVYEGEESRSFLHYNVKRFLEVFRSGEHEWLAFYGQFFAHSCYQFLQRPLCKRTTIVPKISCVPYRLNQVLHTDGSEYFCETLRSYYPKGVYTVEDKYLATKRLYDVFYEYVNVECRTCVANRLCSICWVNMIDENGDLCLKKLKKACNQIRRRFPIIVELSTILLVIDPDILKDVIEILKSRPKYIHLEG